MVKPTQFYTDDSLGMTLRSGMKINCITSTKYWHYNMYLFQIITYINMLDEEEWSDFEEQGGSETWRSILIKNCPDAWILFKDVLIHKYSIDCTRVSIINYYVEKWMKTINSVGDDKWKRTMIKALKDCLLIVNKVIEDRENKGLNTLCGCTNKKRSDLEDEEWIRSVNEGPGYYEDGLELIAPFTWVPTSTVRFWNPMTHLTIEDYKNIVTENQAEWRHDLVDMRESILKKLHYFETVPHKIHQYAFFLISSRLPMECSKKVMSFL